MTFRSIADKYTADVEQARADVRDAQLAYSRGTGSCEAVNKANDNLNRAHMRWQEWQGGRVPDER